MNAVCEKFGHKVSYKYAICGADAIDKVGDPFPEATYEICKDADAVLFSAVGDPKFDNNPTAKVRPEQGLLAMRKKLGLFANIRPVQTFKCLVHKSPLRAELVENADFICIRELTGGMYFGEKYQEEALCIMPSERLFIETDESTVSVDTLYERAAILRKTPLEELRRTIRKNVSEIFFRQ